MSATHLLIVDDSPTQAERLKAILEQEGYQVDVAKNGREALTILAAHNSIELVISDVVMPEMDGYTLCKNIRMHASYSKLPVILLTTLSETEDIIKGLESGANYYVTKPYEDDQIIKHVKNTLSIQKMRADQVTNGKVKVLVNSSEYVIESEKAQILDLLISIYDAAVQKNQQLESAQFQLREFNNTLERKIDDRTLALRVEIDEHKKEINQRKKVQEELLLSEKQFRELSEKLQISLAEKELMLKEIYHRVKNNLQVVSSLLSLQSDGMSDEAVREIILKNVARIKSMSLVHNMLYENDNLSKISMHEYVNNLFRFLYEIYEVDSNRIQFVNNVEDVSIKIDLAIPCGLIINELASNSFKHAFPKGRQGKIQVSLNTDHKQAILKVTDDGIGLPNQQDLTQSKSLGMHLIHNLTKQLDGKLTMHNHIGTEVELRFVYDK